MSAGNADQGVCDEGTDGFEGPPRATGAIENDFISELGRTNTSEAHKGCDFLKRPETEIHMIGYDPYDIASLVKKANSDRLVHMQSVDDLYWKVFEAMLHAHALELRRFESIEERRASSDDPVGDVGWWLERFATAQLVSRHMLDVAKVRERVGEQFYFEQIVDFILLYLVDPVLGPVHETSSREPLDERYEELFEYRIAYPPAGPVSLAVDRLSDSDREFLRRNCGYIRRWSRSLQDPDAIE